MNGLQISVIIPTLNEQGCIAAAVRSAWASGADEVVVCDGGSTDGSLNELSSLDCIVVHSAAGRAAQQNAGARRATGDVLVFQHADNRLGEGSAEQIRHCLFHRSQVVAGGFRQRINHAFWAYRILEWGNAARVRWLRMAYGDQGIFVRREVFQEVGGFADVPLLEDVILMRKLRRIARPALLDGPILVSPRRWQKHGLVRQTLRNWFIVAAFRLGVAPQRLARFYRRHDADGRR